MPKSKSIDNVLSEAEQIARVWTENPTFAMSDVTLPQFQGMITDLRAKRDATETIRTQLTGAINDTNARAESVGTIITRARSGFRAFFGPDSTHFEQAGGTRASDRKRPERKPKPSS